MLVGICIHQQLGRSRVRRSKGTTGPNLYLQRVFGVFKYMFSQRWFLTTERVFLLAIMGVYGGKCSNKVRCEVGLS